MRVLEMHTSMDKTSLMSNWGEGKHTFWPLRFHVKAREGDQKPWKPRGTLRKPKTTRGIPRNLNKTRGILRNLNKTRGTRMDEQERKFVLSPAISFLHCAQSLHKNWDLVIDSLQNHRHHAKSQKSVRKETVEIQSGLQNLLLHLEDTLYGVTSLSTL